MSGESFAEGLPHLPEEIPSTSTADHLTRIVQRPPVIELLQKVSETGGVRILGYDRD